VHRTFGVMTSKNRSRTQAYASSFSACKKAKLALNITKVDVMPTTFSRGMPNLLVLYVQSRRKTVLNVWHMLIDD
jgi:hypothetical protein